MWLSLIKYVAIVAIAVGVGWGIKEFQGNTYLSNSKEKEVVYNEIHVQKEDMLIRWFFPMELKLY